MIGDLGSHIDRMAAYEEGFADGKAAGGERIAALEAALGTLVAHPGAGTLVVHKGARECWVCDYCGAEMASGVDDAGHAADCPIVAARALLAGGDPPPGAR